MRNNINIFRFIAFGMAALSAVLIVLGVYFYVEKDKRLKEYRLIKCKIIRIDEPDRGDVEITFSDLSGTYRPFVYYDHYDPSEDELEYKVDEIYDVYYYPKDTGKSEKKDFIENYETAFILLIIGAAFLLDFPVMLFVANMRKKMQVKSQSDFYGIKDSVISE